MKIIQFALLSIIFTLASSHMQLRQHEFLDNLSDMASFASGDYLSLLPDSIQPTIRKLLGKEKRTGVAGFMDSAKGLLGGGSSNNSGGGFLGGLGDMFGSSSSNGNQNSGASGIFSSFQNAFGGGQQQQQQEKKGGFFSNLLPF